MTTATLTRPKRTRLSERVTSQPGRVDREAGVIFGVKIIGRHSRNGRTYSDRALSEAVNLYEAPASGNYWAACCVSGWLIQATVGRAGGWGGLVTNRSG